MKTKIEARARIIQLSTIFLLSADTDTDTHSIITYGHKNKKNWTSLIIRTPAFFFVCKFLLVLLIHL